MDRYRHRAFGATFDVVAPAAVLARLVPRLPREPAGFPLPDSASHNDVTWRTYEVTRSTSGWRVDIAGSPLIVDRSLSLVLERLRGDAEIWIAITSPHALFVHAGAVAVEGRVLLLPGTSGTGKTTLVQALLRAGACYLSDDYAVLDVDGAVWSYPKPLSVRTPAGRHALDAAALGARIVDGPCDVALVVETAFRPDAPLTLATQGRAAGVLALLRNAPAARITARRRLDVLAKALQHARVLVGPRGDADEAAAALLDRLRRSTFAVS